MGKRARLFRSMTAAIGIAVIAVLPQDNEPYRVLMFTPVRIAALR